jgi:hypothetical protein
MQEVASRKKKKNIRANLVTVGRTSHALAQLQNALDSIENNTSSVSIVFLFWLLYITVLPKCNTLLHLIKYRYTGGIVANGSWPLHTHFRSRQLAGSSYISRAARFFLFSKIFNLWKSNCMSVTIHVLLRGSLSPVYFSDLENQRHRATNGKLGNKTMAVS